MGPRTIVSRHKLERFARDAVRREDGCSHVRKVRVRLLEEPNEDGINWAVFLIDPALPDSEVSYRAFQAIARLTSKYNLE